VRPTPRASRKLDLSVFLLLQDPPFGIHLCSQDFCVLPEGPVVPVHDERVRPYRGIPVFKPSTVVQHYLAPEEMAPYHEQVCVCTGQLGAFGCVLQLLWPAPRFSCASRTATMMCLCVDHAGHRALVQQAE
jgi:hypothetical protein